MHSLICTPGLALPSRIAPASAAGGQRSRYRNRRLDDAAASGPGTKMPRVAIVLHARERFGPETAGAVAMVVHRLAAASPDRTLVLGRAFSGPIFSGIRFQGVRGEGSLAFGVNVIRALRAAAPSVVEIHQQPRLARMVARFLRRTPVFLCLHNDPLDMRGLKRAGDRARLLRHVDRVVCVSDWLKRRFETGIGPSDRVVVLPNPLTLAELPPRAAERRPEILFAGRVVADKGVADFIAACRLVLPRLPGWTARIIGGDRFGPDSPDTPFLRDMRRAAAEAGIVFEGPRPHARVLEAMSTAAIAVVPSRWPEPFGLTALEALASGAALITTAMGGLPEVAGPAALYVPPADAAALADSVLDLATNPGSRAALAEAGLARAARFDTGIIAARMDRLRATALAGGRALAL